MALGMLLTLLHSCLYIRVLLFKMTLTSPSYLLLLLLLPSSLSAFSTPIQSVFLKL